VSLHVDGTREGAEGKRCCSCFSFALWYDGKSIVLHLNHMHNNFMLFSELQKKLSPSPIKTWRLLKQLRDGDRMKEPDDFMMLNRKLHVNVPRFIVELEYLGYGDLKSDDFDGSDMKSDEIKELVNEMRLISGEITESRIQEEMKSPDITADEDKKKIEHQDSTPHSAQQNLKSPEINMSDMKSGDFTNLSREIIATKNELIDTLKGSVVSRDEENMQLRKMLSEFSDHIKTLTQQNTYLSNLLVAPKQQNEPMRSARVRVTEVTDDDVDDEGRVDDLAEHSEDTAARESADAGDEMSDFTDEITDEDDMHQETTPEQTTSGEQVHRANATEKIISDE
jgi:hypothetical protein